MTTWGDPHDEYYAKAQEKQEKVNEMTKQRSRTVSKVKRPTRPKRSMSPKNSIDERQETTKEQSPSPPNNFKYRGRGKSSDAPKKPKPWAGHAHDEYANPTRKKSTDNHNTSSNLSKQTSTSKSDKARRAKSPKGGKRPQRIRFDDNIANAQSYASDDEELEEKSNRPLNSNNRLHSASNASHASTISAPRVKVKKRPKKKPTYVNAANIHAQEFRSAYRKALPPTPQRKTNAQRVENGKEQFNNMIKQAAAMEGV